MKKLLSILLAMIMMLSVFVFTSCSDTTEPEITTVAVTEGTDESSQNEPAKTEPTFKTADYNGDKFTVYFRDQNAEHYRGMYIIPLEGSTDVVDEAAVRRNQMVEEKYNVKFVGKELSRPSSTLDKDIGSGMVDYDIVLDERNYLKDVALKGDLYDFKKLDIDYTTSWWDANCAANYTIYNKLYFMVNDVSVSNLAGIRFYYFNKAVLEDFNLTNPYDYAAKNEWTVENFLSLVKGVSAPGTGEEYGVYGLCSEGSAFLLFNLNGIGVAQSELGSNGEIVCNLLEKSVSDRSELYFSKFLPVHDDTTCALSFTAAAAKDGANASKYTDYFCQVRHLFSEGKFLFTQSTMNGTVDFGDMDKGYGVIMNPKLNTDQERYYHPVDDNANIWIVPKEDQYIDYGRLAVIMDYWAYASSTTVMESYYEITMKTKRATDPTTAEMLDTIKATAAYYPTDIYKVSDISDLIAAGMKTSFATAGKRYSKTISTALNKINKTLEGLKD